jgi:hypothetical protein
MTRTLRIAMAAAVVLGAATASLAGPPDYTRVISPSVPLQGMREATTPPARTDVRVPPYALTGSPAPTTAPTEWRWSTENYGNAVSRTIPRR